MRLLSIAMVSGVLLAGQAAAADLVLEPVAYEPAPAEDWTGFYFGLHAGYALANIDYGGPTPNDGWEPSGVFAGVQAGYNWQMDSFVLGLEGDISYGGAVSGAYVVDGVLFVDENYYVASIDWFGTGRVRAGYDMGGIMPYVTAGFAFAQVHVEEPGDNEDASHFGFAVGGGVEAKLDENWSVKGEYIYASLGEADYYGNPSTLAAHTFKVGVNFGF